MIHSPAASDDYRHPQAHGDTEALYFCFTAADGSLFGWLRLLYTYDRVLEMIALRANHRMWVHQTTIPCAPVTMPEATLEGPQLAFTCAAPWQRWHGRFAGQIHALEEDVTLPLEFELEFSATHTAGHYCFGPYQQGEQEGYLHGFLQLGTLRWDAPLICYRDHSWGQRPMQAATGWDAFILPEQAYMAIVQSTPPFFFGRVCTPAGVCRAVERPTFTGDAESGMVSDPGADFGPLRVTRLGPPITAYLGQPGTEAVRTAPQPGDIQREQIGPALFTDAQGAQSLGFWDRAQRLPEGDPSP